METLHKAPPGIALALPTGQQVLGERAGAREIKEESKRTGRKEKNLESWLHRKGSLEAVC